MPTNKKIFFSYAWGDKKEEGDSREKIVNDLYNSLVQDDYTVVRDKYDLDYRGFISDFMVKIGQGEIVIVAISQKYLKSPYCMFELYEIARNSNFDKYQFGKKILPIIIEYVDLTNPRTLEEYFAYWEGQFNDWNEIVKKRANQLSSEQLARFDRIKMIYQNFGKLSDWLVDMNTLNPIILSENNFNRIKKEIVKLISRDKEGSAAEIKEQTSDGNKYFNIIDIEYATEFPANVEGITSDWIVRMVKESFDSDIYVDSGSRVGIKKGDFVVTVYGKKVMKNLKGRELGCILEEDGTLLEITEVYPEYSKCRIRVYGYDRHMDRNIQTLRDFLNGKGKVIKFNELCENLFPVLKGQLVYFPQRDESILWSTTDDLYNQTLDDKTSKEEKVFLNKQVIRNTNTYLMKYKIGEGYFFDSVLFKKGYSQFQLSKFEESIETFEQYIDYYPRGKSVKGAVDWIKRAKKMI